jgi:hypothetical protein
MTSIKQLALSASVLALLVGCNQPAEQDEAATIDSAATQPATQESTGAETTDVAAVEETESDRINAWFEENFQQNVARSPMTQTFLGMKTNYDQWNDNSPEFDEEF